MKTVTYATVAGDITLDPKEGMQLIRVGGTGDLELEYPDGSTDTIVGVAAGELIYVTPSKILDAGTTATKLTLFWFDRPVVHQK